MDCDSTTTFFAEDQAGTQMGQLELLADAVRWFWPDNPANRDIEEKFADIVLLAGLVDIEKLYEVLNDRAVMAEKQRKKPETELGLVSKEKVLSD